MLLLCPPLLNAPAQQPAWICVKAGVQKLEIDWDLRKIAFKIGSLILCDGLILGQSDGQRIQKGVSDSLQVCEKGVSA
jgi:hypothetical protein